MIKTITRVGNSHGIIFDSALLQLARLKPGDQVNLEVHEGGTITITPVRPEPTPEEMKAVIQETMKEYARTMERLA